MKVLTGILIGEHDREMAWYWKNDVIAGLKQYVDRNCRVASLGGPEIVRMPAIGWAIAAWMGKYC